MLSHMATIWHVLSGHLLWTEIQVNLVICTRYVRFYFLQLPLALGAVQIEKQRTSYPNENQYPGATRFRWTKFYYLIQHRKTERERFWSTDVEKCHCIFRWGSYAINRSNETWLENKTSDIVHMRAWINSRLHRLKKVFMCLHSDWDNNISLTVCPITFI